MIVWRIIIIMYFNQVQLRNGIYFEFPLIYPEAGMIENVSRNNFSSGSLRWTAPFKGERDFYKIELVAFASYEVKRDFQDGG